MTAGGEALWGTLSAAMKYEVAALAAICQSHCAKQIEADMPTSSLEVSDNDPTMETGSDDDSLPEPAVVHVGLTME